MNATFRLALAIAGLLLIAPREASAQFDFAPKTAIQLLLDRQVARPGSTITAGLKLTMPGKWHTYWRNPGEVGKATEINWQLPPGISAGEIQWPVPHKSFSWDLGSYEYSGEVVLLVPLSIAPSVPHGTLSLKAGLRWLECETDGACVPGSGSVSATLVIGDEEQSNSGEFAKWKNLIPSDTPPVKLTARWAGPANDEKRQLILEWPTAAQTNDFYAYHQGNDWQIAPQHKVVSTSDGTITIEKTVSLYEGAWPTQIQGLVVQLDKNPQHPTATHVTATIQSSPAPQAKTTTLSFDEPGNFGGLNFGTGFNSLGPNSVSSLTFDTDTATPGTTVTAILTFKIADHWHMYWRNPGAPYGLPPTFSFNLPAGFSIDESAIRWPVPTKKTYPSVMEEGEIDTVFEYDGEIGFLIPVTVASDTTKGPHTLSIDLSWVECETDSTCISQDQSLSAQLTVGDQSKSSPAAQLSRWESGVPNNNKTTATAWWNGDLSTNQRALVIEWESTDPATDFYPHETTGDWEATAGTEKLSAPAGKTRIQTIVTLNEGDWPTTIAGLLIEGSGTNISATKVIVRVGETPTSASLALAPAVTDHPLLYWLSLAFLGGLILNIMPCVLPVISLKILGFVNQSKEDPGQVRKLGIIYCLGVLASFLIMALMVIGVQRAGNIASWGMQFGNPVFLVCILTLVTLVALNLFGVFEVNLGSGTMDAAGSLAAKHGPAGAFFNGVLATVLATPCTAPFLAPALGFAFLQPPATIIAIFLTVGSGLAIPYLILSMNPTWLRFLPKPGAWMVGFKQAMGFPMLATAMWLLWVATKRFGRDGVLWLGLFLIVVSLAVWIWGEFVQRGTKRKGLAIAFSLFFLATGYGFALEKKLNWRNPAPVASTAFNVPQNLSPDAIQWRPWSHEAIAAARANGQPVLVDFTADWCPTCKANKNFSIDIESTRKKLSEHNYVTLVADNTLLPDTIVLELQSFGRAGVPLVLVYPSDPAMPPIELPEFLTPRIIQDALQTAVN